MKKPQALQLEILERAVGRRRLEELLDEYRGARKAFGSGVSREEGLSEPVTDQEKALLRSYLEDIDQTLESLGKEIGVSGASFVSKANRVAVKLLYQNPLIANQLLDETK